MRISDLNRTDASAPGLTPAEQSALLRAKAARDMGRVAVFECPRNPMVTRLRPAVCADLYIRAMRAQSISDDDALRLPYCGGCPVGSANAEAEGLRAPAKRASPQRPNLRGRIIEAISEGCTTSAEIADRLKASRATVGSRLTALTAEGRVIRTGEIKGNNGVRGSYTYGVAE